MKSPSEAVKKVFRFVDVEETHRQPVGRGEISVGVSLESEPGFREDIIIGEAVDELTEQGYLKRDGTGFFRVDGYPQWYEDG